MKKIIIEIILLFIPFKSVRNRWRRILRGLSFNNIKEVRRFNNRIFDKKRILLIEPNDCHSEVLPGMSKYFLDLGYQVDILTNPKCIIENPFCRFKEDVTIFELNPLFIFFLKYLPIMKKYTNIVLMTSVWYSFDIQVRKYFGLDGYKNLLIVEHETHNITAYDEGKYLENNKLITLWNLDKGKMVNPHYFGNIDTTHQKSDITNFIVVGGIEKKRKNYDLLINTVKTLSQTTDRFKITVVGKGDLEGLEEKYKKFFDIKGRLDYPNMYQELENADYFLTLLDYENEAHHRYLTTGVTGSLQLILGFLKPAVIQKKFADFYRLNNENSIIYIDNQELSQAMLMGINMNNNDYENRKQSIKTLREDVYKMSLDNLKGIVG